MNDIAFFRTDRQPVTLTFTDENHGRALQAVERMPGVLRAESYRSVAVRLHNGHLSGQLSIMGKPKDMDLSRVLDLDDRPIELPASGLVIGGPLLAKVTRVESAGLTKVSALGIEEQWVRTILKA
jgi:putative ABC transport system permease protein